VVQEAYLRAWKGVGKFRGDAAFSTWLYRITANAAASNVQRAADPHRFLRRRFRAGSRADARLPPLGTCARLGSSTGSKSSSKETVRCRRRRWTLLRRRSR